MLRHGSTPCCWAGGRFSKKYLLSTIYSVRAVLIAILVFLPLSPVTLYVFACGIGLLWLGTVPLTNGLAGYLYDATGSYNGAFLTSIGLGVFAALVNLPVNEKPLAERKAAAVPA